MKKQFSWLAELIVGIDYVFKYDQCICPWWTMNKIKNNNKWDLILKIENQKNEKSILMYVDKKELVGTPFT